MGWLWGKICGGLGFALLSIYNVVGNYVLAIIILTVVLKLLMIPMTLKQQRSMEEMSKVKPLLDEAQKKYKNDTKKLGEEQMRIYKEHNISMTAGCLPMLIQLPLIIALYQVISRPITYMLHLSAENLSVIKVALDYAADARVSEIELLNKLAEKGIEFISSLGLPEFKMINFGFLGKNFALAPSASGSWLLIIPIIAGLSTWYSTKLMKKMQPQPKEGEEVAPAMQSMNTMTVMMPFMTASFALTLPAGIGVYIITSNITQIIQQMAMSRARGNTGELMANGSKDTSEGTESNTLPAANAQKTDDKDKKKNTNKSKKKKSKRK